MTFIKREEASRQSRSETLIADMEHIHLHHCQTTQLDVWVASGLPNSEPRQSWTSRNTSWDPKIVHHNYATWRGGGGREIAKTWPQFQSNQSYHQTGHPLCKDSRLTLAHEPWKDPWPWLNCSQTRAVTRQPSDWPQCRPATPEERDLSLTLFNTYACMDMPILEYSMILYAYLWNQSWLIPQSVCSFSHLMVAICYVTS